MNTVIHYGRIVLLDRCTGVFSTSDEWVYNMTDDDGVWHVWKTEPITRSGGSTTKEGQK